MENEISKQILQQLQELKEGQLRLESDVKDLKQGQSKLEAGQNSIETKIDKFQEQFNEHEVKDANRHIEIIGAISDIRTEVITLETISGKNLRDIAALKLAK